MGGKAANDWGLLDMSGNVLEWAWDRDQSNYYQDGQADPTGPEGPAQRVLRGGTFTGYCGSLRSASRAYTTPATRAYTVGFRPVRTIPEP